MANWNDKLMKTVVRKTNENLASLGRRLGYIPERIRENNEFSFCRPLARYGYPRFHIYAKEEGNNFVLNLHLDQKAPSYEGTHSHSGEYEGELVAVEMKRIKGILKTEIKKQEAEDFNID